MRTAWARIGPMLLLPLSILCLIGVSLIVGLIVGRLFETPVLAVIVFLICLGVAVTIARARERRRTTK